MKDWQRRRLQFKTKAYTQSKTAFSVSKLSLEDSRVGLYVEALKMDPICTDIGLRTDVAAAWFWATLPNDVTVAIFVVSPTVPENRPIHRVLRVLSSPPTTTTFQWLCRGLEVLALHHANNDILMLMLLLGGILLPFSLDVISVDGIIQDSGITTLRLGYISVL